MRGSFTFATAFGWLAMAVSEAGLYALSLPAPSAEQALAALGPATANL